MLESTVLAIDISTRGYSTTQLVLAALLFLIWIAALTVATWRLQYVELKGDQRQHKRALKESKTRRDPIVRRFSREELETRSVRYDIRDLFVRAGGPRDSPTRPTIRGAIRQVRSTVRESWRESTSDVPGVAIKLVERAILVATFGGVAVSTSTIVRWITKDPDYPTAADVIAETQEYGSEGTSHLLDTLGLYPYSEFVWAILFAYSIKIGRWIYSHWYYVALSLLAIAGAVWVLERRHLREPRRKLIWSRRSTSIRIGGILVSTWFTGAFWSTAGAQLGFSESGSIVGFTFSLLVLLTGIALSLRRASTRLSRTAEDGEGPYLILAADMVLRHFGAILAAVSVPLVALYVLVGLADGSIAAVVEALLTADRGLQGLVGLLALSLVALLVYMARGAAPAIREALVESLSRATVRTVLLSRGVPYLAVILAYLLAFGLGFSFSLAVVAAVVSGVLARLAIVAAIRVRATASLFGDWLRPDESALFLVVRAYQLEDADGEVRYYAEINSRAVAHDSIEEVVDAVLETADNLVDEEESEPTLPEQYAEDLLKYGIVGIDRSRKKIEQRVREETFGRLESEGMLPESELESELEGEYPPDIWRSKWREWRLSGRLRRKEGYLYVGQ